ncbi:MAG: cyclic nucleotide-binding domain-containing protein [Actinomycetota bacterium]
MTDNRKKALFILGQLNNLDLEWIIKKGRKEKIKIGHILIHEGRQIDALYIVLSGTLSVLMESNSNKELAQISSGEIVGEISFLDTRPPLATVKAIEESQLLAIPRMQLSAKLQQDMGFAARFYKGISLCLSDRMRGTVRLLEYGRDIEEHIMDQQEDVNPSVLENLALAQAKFNWLLESATG